VSCIENGLGANAVAVRSALRNGDANALPVCRHADLAKFLTISRGALTVKCNKNNGFRLMLA
jgi:hypothetical protein